MSDKTKNKYNRILKYPNLIGSAAFVALTAVQLGLFVMWMFNNFSIKGIGCTVLMGASVFFLLKIIVDRVLKREGKTIPAIAVVTVYIITLPTVSIVNFYASIIGLCATLIVLLVIFVNMYFYGEHDKRLIVLICMFIDLCALGYLNRPAFWTGIAETMVFLLIQLYRNLRTKRNNIADKSWRNTLLLFLILVIIMLLPQYFRYNNIKAVRYEKTASEQLAARVILPYLAKDKFDTDERFLLGVIKENEYDVNHSYKDFNRLMARYEADELDMDEIWKNLYRNTYYKYGKDVAKQYTKDVVDNGLAPVCLIKNINDSRRKAHLGYYYDLFQNNKPILSDKYMKFGLYGLFAVALTIILQTGVLLVTELIKGEFKKKFEEGRHRRIEAVIQVIAAGVFWILFETLFSLEGISYAAGIYATITWIIISSFVWFSKKE